MRPFITNWITPYQSLPKRIYLIGLAAVLALAISYREVRFDMVNLHALEARAWLDGRLDIPAGSEDAAVYHGRTYSPYAPFPSLLLVPAVVVFDPAQAPVRGISVLIGIGCILVATRLLKQLGLSREQQWWWAGALFFGTGLWLSVLWSRGVWFFSHVVAVALLLLALHESLGRARGPIVGLLAVCAFLSRYLMLYSLLFLVVAVWQRSAPKGGRAQILQVAGLLAVFALGTGMFLALNEARFGNPFDTGYFRIPLTDHLAPRGKQYGMFHPVYLPFNLMMMFLQGPSYVFAAPKLLAPISMDGMGTSLTFASPFVFLSFWARWDRKLLVAAWMAIAMTLFHMLLYYNNGWVQTNTQRFTLDFFPLLLILIALGAQRVNERIWKGLILWSIALNAFAFLILPKVSQWMLRLS